MARRLRSLEVLETLADLFVAHGVPAHIRSDNGPEFTAALVRHWLAALNVETLFIEPGSPWENGYVGSFNGKLRDELLDREIFYTLTEAQILIERWRREYNTVRTQERPRQPHPEDDRKKRRPFSRSGDRGAVATLCEVSITSRVLSSRLVAPLPTCA